jgi:hypothetical protein
MFIYLYIYIFIYLYIYKAIYIYYNISNKKFVITLHENKTSCLT